MNVKNIIAIPIALCCFINTTSAANFKDVPVTHWAYQYISDVADKGYITADASGYYRPNDYINKFDTAKVLARVAGYKYTNVSADDKAIYDSAYTNNKSLLDKCKSNYKKWITTSDREIAFLLSKQIFNANDLNKFIVKESGAEKLRALSKEEAAVYITRLINADLVDAPTNKFADDASITEKKYVYALQALGILTGDENNKFNPHSAVTRATFAVMLSKSITTEAPATPSPTSAPTKIETISGSIDRTYPALQALQIVSLDNGSKNIYKVAPNAIITVDSVTQTINDLKDGMTLECTLNDGAIVNIKAKSFSTEPSNPNTKSIECTIDSIGTGTTKSIGIQLKMLNPSGGVTTENYTYTLSNDCKISRGTTATYFDSITKGDIAKIKVAEDKVYSIVLEEKNRKLSGATLLEKKPGDSKILVVQDKDNNRFEFNVMDKTFITRKGNGQVPWLELRIGDKLDITSEYNNLVEVYAYGERSTQEGWIDGISIGKNNSAIIKIRYSDNNIKEYNVLSGLVDLYSLRIGNKVKINLDSQEIESINVIESGTTEYVSGVVQVMKRTTMIVNDNSNNREIRYDENTIFIDSRTGDKVSSNKLDENDKVYIVLSDKVSNYAKTVTIFKTK